MVKTGIVNKAVKKRLTFHEAKEALKNIKNILTKEQFLFSGAILQESKASGFYGVVSFNCKSTSKKAHEFLIFMGFPKSKTSCSKGKIRLFQLIPDKIIHPKKKQSDQFLKGKTFLQTKITEVEEKKEVPSPKNKREKIPADSKTFEYAKMVENLIGNIFKKYSIPIIWSSNVTQKDSKTTDSKKFRFSKKSLVVRAKKALRRAGFDDISVADNSQPATSLKEEIHEIEVLLIMPTEKGEKNNLTPDLEIVEMDEKKEQIFSPSEYSPKKILQITGKMRAMQILDIIENKLNIKSFGESINSYLSGKLVSYKTGYIRLKFKIVNPNDFSVQSVFEFFRQQKFGAFIKNDFLYISLWEGPYLIINSPNKLKKEINMEKKENPIIPSLYEARKMIRDIVRKSTFRFNLAFPVFDFSKNNKKDIGIAMKFSNREELEQVKTLFDENLFKVISNSESLLLKVLWLFEVNLPKIPQEKKGYPLKDEIIRGKNSNELITILKDIVNKERIKLSRPIRIFSRGIKMRTFRTGSAYRLKNILIKKGFDARIAKTKGIIGKELIVNIILPTTMTTTRQRGKAVIIPIKSQKKDKKARKKRNSPRTESVLVKSIKEAIKNDRELQEEILTIIDQDLIEKISPPPLVPDPMVFLKNIFKKAKENNFFISFELGVIKFLKSSGIVTSEVTGPELENFLKEVTKMSY
ncbi:hypothetical protein A2995_00710 [Candidatus Nomurabacteria bacterium RIFCSPLOWO2_01_FULL_33_24]|uniref:Uncharacterized protein n=1 Tax=Candidatus Nomurabacteria bacterium RIFCSPLOWO2_01_FULL_33_24 TaxID=1801765 RepID=A0A1F6X180_9BACT|nr:MAG: hypothetical protein A2995_00710 [Candidatus Nomurabacteria bacterium RIFCSPLOWO2_01_FULL_33_24]